MKSQNPPTSHWVLPLALGAAFGILAAALNHRRRQSNKGAIAKESTISETSIIGLLSPSAEVCMVRPGLVHIKRALTMDDQLRVAKAMFQVPISCSVSRVFTTTHEHCIIMHIIGANLRAVWPGWTQKATMVVSVRL